MIATLRGELFLKTPERVVIDVGGVGYDVFFPLAAQHRLPEVGEQVFLHIHTVVRDDALQLFGFVEAEEKELFLQLITVSGVGPKVALNILSNIGAAELANAILADDVARLTRLPGIGKKTAERLCLELKEKVRFIPQGMEAAGGPAPPAAADDARLADVLSALTNLGYPAARAKQALEKVRDESEPERFAAMPLEELLRQALRSLA